MTDLRLIEIELWSKCNRKCSWCPNKYIDRFTRNLFIDSDILINLVESLRKINYSGYISFSRYNEPLLYPEVLNKFCNYLHQELPNCTLVTNTNGDFLTKEIIENLQINELSIMDYDNKGIQACVNKLDSWNCTIDEIIGNFIYAHYNQMKILYYVDWTNNYIPGSRGGFLPIEEPVRNYPCHEPKYFIGINYDGTVSPCCNIRNDIPTHRLYIIGNLYLQSFEEILNSSKRKDIINLCKNSNFSSDSPCYRCSNKGGRYTRKNGGIQYE